MCSLFRGFPNSKAQRAAAQSWSHRLDLSLPRCLPTRGASFPVSRTLSLLAPLSLAKAVIPGHPAAAPRWGHAPDRGPGSSRRSRLRTREGAPPKPLSLGGYLGRQSPSWPRDWRIRLTSLRLLRLLRLTLRPLPRLLGRVAHRRPWSRAAGCEAARVLAPEPDFLPGGMIAFLESSQVPASAGLVHLLASETSIHCPGRVCIHCFFPSGKPYQVPTGCRAPGPRGARGRTG